MITRLKVKGFKSLADVSIDFPRFTVLFGPNASGKSNVLEAAQMLSRVGTGRTLSDAFAEPIRGYPLEAFAFPPGGLPELLSAKHAAFTMEAEMKTGADLFCYRVSVDIHPGSGSLSISDEYLARLTRGRAPKGNPVIEQVDGRLRVRRKSKPAHPIEESLGLNHTQLSNPRLSGVEYSAIERCRRELEAWRVYYLDPRVAMRSARPPSEVQDIGVLGDDIAPFLYRLRSEHPRQFGTVKRTLRTLIPSVEDLDVDLDKKRGTLDIQVRQNGCDFSSRIISEGTLRVLALCAIAASPWGTGMVAFEEPENGVHPRRLELIASLLMALAREQERQVIVTTHSALFCGMVLRLARDIKDQVSLMSVKRNAAGTQVWPMRYVHGLFQDSSLDEAIAAPMEDGKFESFLMRGLLDA